MSTPNARITGLIAIACLIVTTHCAHRAQPKLADLSAVAPGIVIDLRYATRDNFFKVQFYSQNARAMLLPATARKLAGVQADLAKRGLGLKVWDAYRPLSVQRAMWQTLPDPRYVADPATGGRHTRGTAVDVTLVDAGGRELAMPTGHDDFTEKAGAYYPHVSPEEAGNRKILQDAMTRHGFLIFETEWWHFDDEHWQAAKPFDASIQP